MQKIWAIRLSNQSHHPYSHMTITMRCSGTTIMWTPFRILTSVVQSFSTELKIPALDVLEFCIYLCFLYANSSFMIPAPSPPILLPLPTHPPPILLPPNSSSFLSLTWPAINDAYYTTKDLCRKFGNPIAVFNSSQCLTKSRDVMFNYTDSNDTWVFSLQVRASLHCHMTVTWLSHDPLIA